MHGTGDMRWSNGDRFSGEWKEARPRAEAS